MRLLAHVALSALLSAILYFIFNSPAAFAAFLSGALIDGDHVIDFLLWSPNRSVRSFLVLGTWFTKPHVTDLMLHSYELLIPLWGIVYLTGTFTLGISLTAGFMLHLLTDQVFNDLRYGTSPFTYFLCFRILRMRNRYQVYEKRLAISKAVLERDDYKCQVCGKGEKPLEVHMEKFAKGNESPEQYITVCPSCHTRKHVLVWKLLGHT